MSPPFTHRRHDHRPRNPIHPIHRIFPAHVVPSRVRRVDRRVHFPLRRFNRRNVVVKGFLCRWCVRSNVCRRRNKVRPFDLLRRFRIVTHDRLLFCGQKVRRRYVLNRLHI